MILKLDLFFLKKNLFNNYQFISSSFELVIINKYF